MPGNLLAKSPMDERLAKIIEPSITGMGFQLVRVRLMGGSRPTLQIMAERPDGTMEVDDCAALSHTVSAVLDVDDPIDGEYVLEVSSPGIDRPLTRPADFERYEGFEAKVETRDLIDGRKRWKGEIVGVAGGEETGEPVHIVLEFPAPKNERGEAFERVALPFDALADAKLVMTDALIEESLKGRARPGSAGDGQQVDLETLGDIEATPAPSDDEDATEEHQERGANDGRSH